MAEGTFRPRPIDAPHENAAPIPANPDGPKISGNPPPALQAILNARRSDADAPPPEDRPRRIQPQSAGAEMTQSNLKAMELRKVLQSSRMLYEAIRLPSKGRFYDGRNGPADGVLHVRPMTGEEEQILATPRFVKDGRAINMIFERCMQEEFKAASLLSVDRTYLLVYLRGISYTPQYDVEVRCPNCDRKFATVIDLNTMDVEDCPDDYGPADLEDVMPTSGFKFRYRLATGDDDQRVKAYQDRRIKLAENVERADDTLMYRTAIMIDDIEGVTEKKDIQMLLRDLPMNDLAYLRNVVNEPPFGLDTKVEIPCPGCSLEFEIELPMEAGFFFPKAKRKTRATS